MTISEAFEARIFALVGEGRVEKTLKNYRCAKNSLINATGDIPIELFGDTQLAIWYTYMKEEACSDSTIRGYYQLLKSVLSYLLDNGQKVMEPRRIKAPGRDTPPRTVLTPQEIQSLIDACKNPRDKAIVALLFTTGARPFEILNIEKDHFIEAPFDSKGRQEVFVLGKGGKYRPIFINPTTQRYLHAYLDTRRHPVTGKLDYYKPLFMSGQNRQITLSRVEQIFHTAAAHAGLTKRVTPYVMRHSFATNLLENKAPIEHVSKTLGHSNVAMTSKVYSHVNTEVQKDTVDEYLTPIS